MWFASQPFDRFFGFIAAVATRGLVRPVRLFLFPGARPFALGYSGWQFGSFRGQLGDGRVIHFGTLKGWQVSLKGAGRSPFSRSGDGRATLESSLREFFGTAFLVAIGIPCIQSIGVFAAWDPADQIWRDKWYDWNYKAYTAGVGVRAAPSFLRFGSVEYAASQPGHHAVLDVARQALMTIAELESRDEVKLYTGSATLGRIGDTVQQECFFMGDRSSKSCASRLHVLTDRQVLECLLERVTARTAALVAGWMAAGFVHGVMNTDNMSLIGYTMDLNVFGFVGAWNTNRTFNFVDDGKRYAFGHQPSVALWNLERLARVLAGSDDSAEPALPYALVRLSSAYSASSKQWVEQSFINATLSSFMPLYEKCFLKRVKHRLGVSQQGVDGERIAHLFLELVATFPLDYHNFSRSLVQVVERDPTLWDNPQRWASLLIKSSLIKAPALLGRMQQLTGHLSATFNSSALRTFWQQHVAKVVPAVAFRSRQVESIINQYIHRRHHLETEGDFRVGEQVFDTCGAHHGNSNTWSTNNSSESLDLLLSALQSPFQLVNEIWSRQLLPRSRVSPARARPRAAHRSLATGLIG